MIRTVIRKYRTSRITNIPKRRMRNILRKRTDERRERRASRSGLNFRANEPYAICTWESTLNCTRKYLTTKEIRYITPPFYSAIFVNYFSQRSFLFYAGSWQNNGFFTVLLEQTRRSIEHHLQRFALLRRQQRKVFGRNSVHDLSN